MTVNAIPSTEREVSINPSDMEMDSASTTQAHEQPNSSQGSSNHITTTTTKSDSIQYEPNNNGEENKENGNSVEINIHLIEETEQNRGTRVKRIHLRLILVLIFIISAH
jgi:hypothetical protein